MGSRVCVCLSPERSLSGSLDILDSTLCYAIVLPGRKYFEAFPIGIRPKSSPEARFPARKPYCVT